MGIKDIRRNYILDRAIKIFCEKSISEVKIKDIAAACNIGEATFYRYFSKRSTLVIACTMKLVDKMYDLFLDDGHGNGYDRLTRFYYHFYEVFGDHPEYYRFLSEFDASCLRGDYGDLMGYSKRLDCFQDYFIAAYKDGVADGSVKELWDVDLFYFATTHALLSLCKKLAAEAYIVMQDGLTDKRQEVRTIIEIILNSLKK